MSTAHAKSKSRRSSLKFSDGLCSANDKRFCFDWTRWVANRLAAIFEPTQRRLAFSSEVARLDPDAAALVVELLLVWAFEKPAPQCRLTCDAALLSVIEGNWESDHLARTRECCAAFDNPLSWTFLAGLSDPSAFGEDEQAVIPAPNYGVADRHITLGERRSMALRPSRTLIAHAMRDPHPMVTRRLLDNPKLTENDVVWMAARRPAVPEILKIIALHRRWRYQTRAMNALVYNPQLPLDAALSLLPLCNFHTVREISSDAQRSNCLQTAARLLIETRPVCPF